MKLEEAKKVLKKNKGRLAQELKESKELLYLIRQSTFRKLSEEEKIKVKEQLGDIVKAVPALGVFMLPGGALLLPLLLKIIPDLLPSAFREDNDDTEIEAK